MGYRRVVGLAMDEDVLGKVARVAIGSTLVAPTKTLQ